MPEAHTHLWGPLCAHFCRCHLQQATPCTSNADCPGTSNYCYYDATTIQAVRESLLWMGYSKRRGYGILACFLARHLQLIDEIGVNPIVSTTAYVNGLTAYEAASTVDLAPFLTDVLDVRTKRSAIKFGDVTTALEHYRLSTFRHLDACCATGRCSHVSAVHQLLVWSLSRLLLGVVVVVPGTTFMNIANYRDLTTDSRIKLTAVTVVASFSSRLGNLEVRRLLWPLWDASMEPAPLPWCAVDAAAALSFHRPQ